MSSSTSPGPQSMQQLLHELKTIGDPRISEVTRRATAQIHAARDLGLDPDTRFYGLMRTQDLEWLPVSIASSLDEMSYGVDKLVSDRALKTLLAAKAAFVEFRESQGSQSIDECLNWTVSQPDFETVDTRRKLSALHGMRVISSAVGHPVVKAALDHAATKFQEKSGMIAELRTDLSEPGRDMNIALDQALHCLYTARPLPFGILATEVEADISSFLRDGTPLSGGTFGDWPLKKLAYEAAKDMLSKEDPGENSFPKRLRYCTPSLRADTAFIESLLIDRALVLGSRGEVDNAKDRQALTERWARVREVYARVAEDAYSYMPDEAPQNLDQRDSALLTCVSNLFPAQGKNLAKAIRALGLHDHVDTAVEKLEAPFYPKELSDKIMTKLNSDESAKLNFKVDSNPTRRDIFVAWAKRRNGEEAPTGEGTHAGEKPLHQQSGREEQKSQDQDKSE